MFLLPKIIFRSPSDCNSYYAILRSLIVCLLLCPAFFLHFSASPAMAEDTPEQFYVELGRATSEAEAATIWNELKEKHKKILSAYQLFPNPILQEDGGFTYRVQAGPIADKQTAQRVCNRLFRRKVQCFVIEGFDPSRKKTFAEVDDNAQGAIADSPPTSSGFQDFILPWLRSDDAPAPASQPAPQNEAQNEAQNESLNAEKNESTNKNQAQAKVDVAEAIAVPVTENNEVSVESPPEILSFWSDSNTAAQGPGWISIRPFLDENRLNRFWLDLKKRSPQAVRALSMKAIRPLVSHDIPQVILALGVFNSETEAAEFCRDHIASFHELECSFSPQPPEGEETGAKNLQPAAVILNAVENKGDEVSLFWAEVLAERNQDKALEKWEKIRTDNDDLLANTRSQITNSLANPELYKVRIGPMKTKTKAAKLCRKLKERGVECSVSSL